MAQQVIDAMDNPGLWAAFAADGVTPSAELALSADAQLYRFGPDRKSGRLTATLGALDHVLRRSLPGTDLSSFEEIRLWLHSNRPANGSPERPFYLELRLASAAMGLEHPDNLWYRYFPVFEVRAWESIRLSLVDLPPQIRGAVNLMQLRCIEATTPFSCNLDDVLAVRLEMITDVDAALLYRLDSQATLNGSPVPAVLHHPEASVTPSMPFIRVAHYEVVPANARQMAHQERADYTAIGFRLRPPPAAYDLYYEVDVFADERAQKAHLMEFVLRALAPRSTLLANGSLLPIEWVPVEAPDRIGGHRTDRAPLHFRVSTRQEVGPPEPETVPYQSMAVLLEQKAGAG